MISFLPQKILKHLKGYEHSKISEIRLREQCKISLLYNGNIIKLKNTKILKKDIEETVLSACKRSIYSYDEDIKNGFITTDKGVRIGLAGQFVIENEKIKTIRDFSSLVIRIPNEIIGFANDFYDKIYISGGILVISKTGVGKTTFIRDFTRLLSLNDRGNVVVIDERNEICAKTNNSQFFLGDLVDVLTYSPKEYGFTQAVRTLNPNYVVTDELISKNDCEGVLRAYNSGVNVIATIHSSSIERLLNISYIKDLLNYKCFEYYVLISLNNGNRVIEVYDKNLNKICLL